MSLDGSLIVATREPKTAPRSWRPSASGLSAIFIDFDAQVAQQPLKGALIADVVFPCPKIPNVAVVARWPWTRHPSLPSPACGCILKGDRKYVAVGERDAFLRVAEQAGRQMRTSA
jgi:hypothetical protein